MLIYEMVFPNGKRYIGMTRRTLQDRLNDHKKKSASSRRGAIVHSAIRKYGWENIVCNVLLRCDNEEELSAKEIHFIKKFRTMEREFGYNLREGGASGGLLSDETKRKISESRKGKCTGEAHPFWGKTHSDETRGKISESKKGHVQSDEVIRKRVASRKGYTHSDETKRKISESLKGCTHSDETKKKLSEANRGKHTGEANSFWGKSHSDESKTKMSEFYKERCAAGMHPRNRRTIITFSDGSIQTFDSAKAAAEEFDVNPKILYKAVKRGHFSKHSAIKEALRGARIAYLN